MQGVRACLLAAALLGPTVVSEAAAASAIQPVCTTVPSKGANLNTDCQADGNFFETTLAVNPRDPRNIVGGVIKIGGPGGGPRTIVVEPRVSFDGGVSWATYAVDFAPGTVDPSVAFDAAGTVYLSGTSDGDIVVSSSRDGGRSWSSPVIVAAGSLGDQGGVFNDHPQLTAWGNGHVLVTWIRDLFGADSNLISAPVYDAASSDQGATWGPSRNISGSAPFCTGRTGGSACDQTFGNSVAFARGGAVVTFQQTYDEAPDAEAALGRNRYLSVVVNPLTGAPVRGPFLIGQAYDGITEHDYPVGAGGVQTVHDSQFGLDGMGNVAADPTDHTGRHFAVVWTDDRNAPRPVDADPYKATTDADIIVSETRNAGRSWSPPTAIHLPNDQFMPWAAYDSQGRLRVGFFDRSYDPANHKYGYTLASEGAPGSLAFSMAHISTALSDPTRDNTASRGTINPAFPNPAASIGDYTAIAVGPTFVAALWTDLRETGCVSGRCGFRQDAYFASVPSSGPSRPSDEVAAWRGRPGAPSGNDH